MFVTGLRDQIGWHGKASASRSSGHTLPLVDEAGYLNELNSIYRVCNLYHLKLQKLDDRSSDIVIMTIVVLYLLVYATSKTLE